MKKGTLVKVSAMEFSVAGASSWLRGFAGAFAALAVGTVYLGAATLGVSDPEGFSRTALSLLNLSLLLVPLPALAVTSSATVAERGSLWDLLAVQPVSRWELLLGRYLGLAWALAAAVLPGLGGAGLVLALLGATRWLPYLAVTGVVLLLVFSLVSIGTLLGICARDRLQALVLSLCVWLVSVFALDVAASILALSTPSPPSRWGFAALLLANPVDLARLSGTALLGAWGTMGAGGAWLLRSLGTSTWFIIGGLLAACVALPLAIAGYWLNRKDM